ncbi:MAG: hypothetical protein ACKO96_39980, partial [Flammeovirgaceae bacterium]
MSIADSTLPADTTNLREQLLLLKEMNWTSIRNLLWKSTTNLPRGILFESVYDCALMTYRKNQPAGKVRAGKP